MLYSTGRANLFAATLKLGYILIACLVYLIKLYCMINVYPLVFCDDMFLVCYHGSFFLYWKLVFSMFPSILFLLLSVLRCQSIIGMKSWSKISFSNCMNKVDDHGLTS